MTETLLVQLAALGEVIFINLVLSGDNAVVVGIAAQGVAPRLRSKVIVMGISAAVVLRILFAVAAVYLLGVVGLTLAGGLLLFWVCWGLWKELRRHDGEEGKGEEREVDAGSATMRTAITSIVLADVSMSLDNVLAVAGAAREHMWVMISGLLLSVIFMGLAATLIAKLMERFPWIAYLGLAVIVVVAGEMTWDGGLEVWDVLRGLPGS